MALKYINSKYLDYSGSLQVTTGVPLDVRAVVEHLSDLTTASTWYRNGTIQTQPISYNGMLVAVEETNDIYMCINVSQITSLVNGWKKVTNAGINVSIVTIKKYDAYYNVPEGGQPNPGKSIALYDPHEIEFVSEESKTMIVWYRVDDPNNDENVVPDISATHNTIIAEANGQTKGVVINDELEAGVYLKVVNLDNGAVTYSLIDFTEIYEAINNAVVAMTEYVDENIETVTNTINDLSTHVANIDIVVEDISSNLSKLAQAFIFKGNALVNSDPTVTPDTSNYLVADEYDTPIPNLRGGDVYQTDEDMEFAYVADSEDAGHWVELGPVLGGFIRSVSCHGDNYINIETIVSADNSNLTINVSANVTTINGVTSNTTNHLVTALDVSNHLTSVYQTIDNVSTNIENLNSSIIETEEVIADTFVKMAQTIGMNSSFGVDWDPSTGFSQNITYKEAIENTIQKLQWVIIE